ncbi:hypothetical protein GH913_10845 [Xanthomonas citri pv. malvacearum]|nr:hypothetical protein GH913_10845 [Xanthomonas citri pv. malvacearum]
MALQKGQRLREAGQFEVAAVGQIKSAGDNTRLDTAEPGPIKIDHRIDVIGGADVFSQWIRHQQANDCSAEEDYVFAKLAQCIRNHKQVRQIRIEPPRLSRRLFPLRG